MSYYHDKTKEVLKHVFMAHATEKKITVQDLQKIIKTLNISPDIISHGELMPLICNIANSAVLPKSQITYPQYDEIFKNIIFKFGQSEDTSEKKYSKFMRYVKPSVTEHYRIEVKDKIRLSISGRIRPTELPFQSQSYSHPQSIDLDKNIKNALNTLRSPIPKQHKNDSSMERSFDKSKDFNHIFTESIELQQFIQNEKKVKKEENVDESILNKSANMASDVYNNLLKMLADTKNKSCGQSFTRNTSPSNRKVSPFNKKSSNKIVKKACSKNMKIVPKNTSKDNLNEHREYIFKTREGMFTRNFVVQMIFNAWKHLKHPNEL